MGFPSRSVAKNPLANAGDAGLDPGSGRFPGGGNGNPLQCSCLENPTDRGGWLAQVHGVAESDVTWQLKSLALNPICLVSLQGGKEAQTHKEDTGKAM